MWIKETGDSDKRVDLVFVAEGYTVSEQDRFYADAQALTDAMFAANRLNSPYHEYQSYFNVRALFTPSAESGYSTDNQSVDTAFDAVASLSDGRGISGNGNAVRRFVNQETSAQAQDIIVVLVNTDDYGGAASGNITWVTSRHAKSTEVLLHEVGHSFAGLVDEYVDVEAAQLFPIADATLANSGHLTADRTDLPWSAWMGFEDSLGVVGVYEGGFYRDEGVWRATPTSKMRDFDEPFSAPQKEAIVLSIYEAVGAAAHLEQLTPFVYRVQPIDPARATVTWSAGSAETNAYDFGVNPMTTFGLGLDQLSVSISDASEYVREGIEALTEVVSLNLDEGLTRFGDLGRHLNQVFDQAVEFSAGADRVALDRLTGSFLSFGQGNDVLALNLNHEQVDLESLSDSVLLLSSSASDAREYLATADLERFVFGDGRAYAINDTTVEQAYRLYQAAFSRRPDDGGLGYWTNVLDHGASLDTVAKGFTQSPEFVALYGADLTHQDFVAALYLNALGREQDAAGAAYWVSHLDSGRLQAHEVLTRFSESPENIERLAPVLEQGVWFESVVA